MGTGGGTGRGGGETGLGAAWGGWGDGETGQTEGEAGDGGTTCGRDVGGATGWGGGTGEGVARGVGGASGVTARGAPSEGGEPCVLSGAAGCTGAGDATGAGDEMDSGGWLAEESATAGSGGREGAGEAADRVSGRPGSNPEADVWLEAGLGGTSREGRSRWALFRCALLSPLPDETGFSVLVGTGFSVIDDTGFSLLDTGFSLLKESGVFPPVSPTASTVAPPASATPSCPGLAIFPDMAFCSTSINSRAALVRSFTVHFPGGSGCSGPSLGIPSSTFPLATLVSTTLTSTGAGLVSSESFFFFSSSLAAALFRSLSARALASAFCCRIFSLCFLSLYSLCSRRSLSFSVSVAGAAGDAEGLGVGGTEVVSLLGVAGVEGVAGLGVAGLGVASGRGGGGGGGGGELECVLSSSELSSGTSGSGSLVRSVTEILLCKNKL